MYRHYWHLGNYHYVFYIYELAQIIQRQNSDFVLDAGCGRIDRIPSPVKHLVGVDVSRSNIVAMHQAVQGDFIVASLTHLPFKSEVFDNVKCIDVLEHVAEKESVFVEIARVSKQNAHFVGSTTNQLNPLFLLDESLPVLSRVFVKYVGDRYDRHSRLNFGTLTDMLKASGFDVSISLLGFPQFTETALCEYHNMKVPWFGFIWVLFDKVTDHFRILKEIIIFDAVKQ
jgi:SAM-dependent methyltransferase